MFISVWKGFDAVITFGLIVIVAIDVWSSRPLLPAGRVVTSIQFSSRSLLSAAGVHVLCDRPDRES